MASKESLEVAQMILHQQESDRGCVIFCAARLEDDLESVLRAHCSDDDRTRKEVVDPLFRGYAPLSTFSAKIQVSYAFGLIPKHLYQTLDLIRKLRNDFAHSKGPVSFQTPEIKNRLRSILNSAQPEYAKEKTSDEPDDDELVTGMGRLTKRQFVDRLAFCLVVAITSAKLSVHCDLHLIAQGARRKHSQKLQKDRTEQQ